PRTRDGDATAALEGWRYDPHKHETRQASRQRLQWIPTAPIDTREERPDNSPVGSKRGQNIVENRGGGRSPPTTVNSSVRTREYLTTAEIERLMAAARKSSRYGHRDATMILIGYRHGLRASELCDLQWSQVELATGRLHVRRAKNGSPRVHPTQGDEIRALRRLQREQGLSWHVFMSERDGPMTPKAFHALFGRIGSRAKMQFPIHPHMLRHGCGYALANAGHDTRALQALADPKMKARLADLGATALPSSPADLGKFIADETEKWGKVVKFAGIKAD